MIINIYVTYSTLHTLFKDLCLHGNVKCGLNLTFMMEGLTKQLNRPLHVLCYVCIYNTNVRKYVIWINGNQFILSAETCHDFLPVLLAWRLVLTSLLSYNEQLVLGLCVYLIPITPLSWRAALMPMHIYSGLFIFTSVIAAALMGITEKLIFGLYVVFVQIHTFTKLGHKDFKEQSNLYVSHL